jgi:hypothetical protein
MKRKSYSVELKLEAIKYAKQNTILAASKKFKVDRVMVRDWMKQEESLEVLEYVFEYWSSFYVFLVRRKSAWQVVVAILSIKILIPKWLNGFASSVKRR